MIGYEHKFCHGVLHKGSHIHQALPITSGERWNLIIWARSSEAHANCCPICSSSPNLYLLEHLGTAFVCRTLHCRHAILTKDNKDMGNPTE